MAKHNQADSVNWNNSKTSKDANVVITEELQEFFQRLVFSNSDFFLPVCI